MALYKLSSTKGVWIYSNLKDARNIERALKKSKVVTSLKRISEGYRV